MSYVGSCLLYRDLIFYFRNCRNIVRLLYVLVQMLLVVTWKVRVMVRRFPVRLLASVCWCRSDLLLWINWCIRLVVITLMLCVVVLLCLIGRKYGLIGRVRISIISPSHILSICLRLMTRARSGVVLVCLSLLILLCLMNIVCGLVLSRRCWL